MRNIIRLIFILTLTVPLSSCFLAKKVDTRWAMDRNVCKKLKGEALVYAIFVDSKTTKPWVGYDIRTAIDSIQYALNWIQDKADAEGVPLNIQFDYYQSDKKFAPLKKDLPDKSLYKTFTLEVKDGTDKIDKWANSIAKKVMVGMGTTTSEKLPSGIPKSNLSKLVLKLKKKYKVEEVVILFMMNNYYVNDVYATFNYGTDEEIEYTINNFKDPAIIAQQVMTLFGATALMPSALSKMQIQHLDFAQKRFPKDIMVDYKSHLSDFKIGDYTRYLIGWTNRIDPEYEKLFIMVKKRKNKKQIKTYK